MGKYVSYSMAHTLPPLPYAYNALEPFIDEQTMKLHHDKHHQTYVDKLNAAVKGTPFENTPVDEIMRKLDTVPDSIKTAVRNHGGGHSNHTFFWNILAKGTNISKHCEGALKKNFGSFDTFKEEFTNSTNTVFGSGWAWLVSTNGKLEIITTPNQDSPLSTGKVPLIGIDVWEHAYYLKYQNKRAEYIEAFWNVVNWNEVEKLMKNCG